MRLRDTHNKLAIFRPSLVHLIFLSSHKLHACVTTATTRSSNRDVSMIECIRINQVNSSVCKWCIQFNFIKCTSCFFLWCYFVSLLAQEPQDRTFTLLIFSCLVLLPRVHSLTHGHDWWCSSLYFAPLLLHLSWCFCSFFHSVFSLYPCLSLECVTTTSTFKRMMQLLLWLHLNSLCALHEPFKGSLFIISVSKFTLLYNWVHKWHAY